MDQFSSGFQTSQAEIILFSVLFGLILVGLVVGQIMRSRTAAKAARTRKPPREPVLRRTSQPRREHVQLGYKEQQTLDRLAWFLKDPSKADTLLDDHAALLKVSRRGIREGVVKELDVHRLARRVGADTSALRIAGHSTQTIPTGAEVSISTAAMAMGNGVVQLSSEAGVQVRFTKGEGNFSAGEAVDVVCYSSEGMYQFHTTMLSVTGKNALLRHTPHVQYAQRRTYRRREIEMPVRIRMPGIDHKPLDAVTVDMSIGGAAVTNRKKQLGLGAFVELSIEIGSAAPLVVQGTVVRLSKRNKVAHVSFSGMDQQVRHRLFRRLIRAG